MKTLLFPAFKTSLDPTRIVSGPTDAEVVSGTTAQLICQAEYDKSLQDSFELVWRKGGDDIPLSAEENSRSVGRFLQKRERVWLCSVYLSLRSRFSSDRSLMNIWGQSGDKKTTLSRLFISSIFQVRCGRWCAADNECSPEWRRNLHVHRSNQSRRDERHCPAHRTGWDGFVTNIEPSITRYDTRLGLTSPRTAGMSCVYCCRCSRCPPESRNHWYQESEEHQPVVGAGERSQQLGYR